MYILELTVPSNKFSTTYKALSKRKLLGRNCVTESYIDMGTHSEVPCSLISWTYSSPARAKTRRKQISDWLHSKTWESRKDFFLSGEVAPPNIRPVKDTTVASAKRNTPKSSNGVYVTRKKRR